MSEENRSFETLVRDVIDKGFCSLCGTCAATCPVNAIAINGRPHLVSACEGCGLCYAHCPQTEPLEDPEFARLLQGGHYVEGIGHFREAYIARSKIPAITERAYKGGVVTSLLLYLMDKGIIDAAIVTHATFVWEAYPHVALTRDDIIRAAGTKYTSSPVVLGLASAVIEMNKHRVAVVGVPCHIRAIRKMMYSEKGYLKLGHAVAFTIGIFCMESMHFERFLRFLWNKGVKIENVKKFEITKGKFIAIGKDGSELLKVPVRELEECMMNCRKNCGDFTAETADISVGAVGAPQGWSTVIIRTKLGEMVFRGAVKEGYLEASHVVDGQLRLDIVMKLGLSKKGVELKPEPETEMPPTARA
ncbi:MAG: Coenzyme F420 hydrogenase/dehydrogenase, beta subunit C-terminal domain [Candidatus Nezhaarchaeales archaeon]